MSANAIRAGRAFVELFADDSRLARGLKRAQARVRAFAAAVRATALRLSAAGAAAATPLLAMTASFARAGDALDKMSARVGASVEFLSALNHAAQLGGTSIAEMEIGIRRMQRNAKAATRGTGLAADAFRQLGISVTDSTGRLKSTETLFLDVAGALSTVENNTLRAALASTIFGRAGTKLLPMLRDGAKGLRSAMDEAKSLGLVMSTEDATSAAALTDAFFRLKQTANFLKLAIGRQLAPAMIWLSDALRQTVPPIIDFIRSSGPLIPIIFGVGAAVAAAGAAFLGLSIAATTVSFAIGAISTVLSAVAGIVGAILSPWGLFVAALVGAAAAAVNFTGAGQQLLSDLKDGFASLAQRATDSFGAIIDALSAGDFKLAAQILWLTLKTEWIRGVNILKTEWKLWLAFFRDTFDLAGAQLTKAAFTTWGALKTIWSGVTTALANAMTTAISTIKIGWVNFAAFFQKIWLRIKSLFTSVDLAKEIDRINTAAERKAAKIRADAAGTIADRSAAHAQNVERNARTTADLNRDIDRQLAARRRKTDDARRKALEPVDDPELARLRAELERAKLEAQFKAQKAAVERAKLAARANDPGADDDPPGPAKSSARGAFLSSAIRGLATTSIAERTASAAEKTAEGVDKLNRKADNGKLVFAD